MSSVPPTQPKKPLTKRWWFWVIIVFVVLAVIGALGDSTEGDSSATSTKAEATSEEPATVAASQESEQAEEPTEEPSEEPEAETVKYGKQEWTCMPVPDDLMERLLDGSTYNGTTVAEKSTMVQGEDNFFIAAEVVYPDADSSFEAVFTSPIDGTGPITSATKGTAQLFNWPQTPGGKLDGAYAAEKCLEKM